MDISEINKPKICDILLSNKCMLKCKMCYLWKNEDFSSQSSERLGNKEYKKLLYDLKAFVDASFHVSFSGGEPLLDSNLLFEVAKICRELDFETYFPTNAYLIDDAMAKRIAEAEISCVGLSLDSIDTEIHDFIRGKRGSWEKAMKAIGHLERNCPDTSINILTVIMGVNFNGIIDLARWVYNHPGLMCINFQAIQKPFNISCPDNWYKLKEYAKLWPSDTFKVNSLMDELISLKRDFNDFKIGNPIQQLELFKTYFKNPAGFTKPKKCHLGDVIRVDSFGDIRTCYEMESIGNIKEKSIRTIWSSEKAEETRLRISSCAKNCHHLVNCYYG